jgi:hypothetical protein
VCEHCQGTGECDQICCTGFGQRALSEDGRIVFVCMVCRGRKRR